MGVIKLFYSGEKGNQYTTTYREYCPIFFLHRFFIQKRTMYTIVKNSVKNGPLTTRVSKIQLSNDYKHRVDICYSLYNNNNMEKILSNPKDKIMFLNDIGRTMFEKRPYPIELATQINLFQSMFPYPKYSRNMVVDVLKYQNKLPNPLFISNMNIDKKVNINFFAEAYLISNTNFESPKIISRQIFNEKEKIDTNLSIQHCHQEHCDGQVVLSFDNTDTKKMVDVKLSRLTVDQGSKIYPVILDMENQAFTGIRNEPYMFKEYLFKKDYNLRKLTEQLTKQQPRNIENITQHLNILHQVINENMDFQTKLNLIQEYQHKLFCLINQHNLENIKPRYNPEILHITTGTYKEEALPDMLKSVHKQRISLNTIFQTEHPEIYKNIGLCKNTLWGWDNTYLDKIEFDIFI